MTGVRDQSDGMEEVVNHYRFKNVEFEVALRAGEANGSGSAVDLYADHRHGFGLRWVHFARHDRRTRFILRDGQFAETTTWAGSQPANIIRNLHERRSQRFQRALCEDDLVVC